LRWNIINASTIALNTISSNALYIQPIRLDTTQITGILMYNSTNKEVVYNTNYTPSSIAILQQPSTTKTYYPMFVSSTGQMQPYIDNTINNFSYVPDSGTLTVQVLTATSSKELKKI
jgi:hypothetical protein